MKNEKFYKTNPSGISLIVLVITIIVIIILAAAVILTLNKNNPIEEANKARYESDVASIQAIFTNTVTKVMAQNQSTIEVNAGELNSVKIAENEINNVEGRVSYKLDNPQDESNKEGTIIFNIGTNNATTYYTGRMLPLYSAGKTTWYVDREGVISLEVGEKKYGNGTQTEGSTGDSGEFIYEEAIVGEKVTGNVKQYIDENGDRAIIPIGFAIVPGKTDVSHGLVISDLANDMTDSGNQFVWIPVENMETFVREEGYQKNPNGEVIVQNSLIKRFLYRTFKL